MSKNAIQNILFSYTKRRTTSSMRLPQRAISHYVGDNTIIYFCKKKNLLQLNCKASWQEVTLTVGPDFGALHGSRNWTNMSRRLPMSQEIAYYFEFSSLLKGCLQNFVSVQFFMAQWVTVKH